MNLRQYIRSCTHQFRMGRLVGKVSLGVVFALLFLVAAFAVNTPGAQAHTNTGCSGQIYNVVSGDTLSAIALRYRSSVAAIATQNGIANPDLIFVDQRLCIPVQGAASGTTYSAPSTQQSAPSYSAPVQPAQRTAPQAPAPAQRSGGSVESIIYQVFGSEAPGALNVARCESGLNPSATNPSGAAGVFQIMPGTWSTTSRAGSSPYDAYSNIVAAHEIFVRDGHSWGQWVCKP